MHDPILILLVDDSPYFLAAARDFLQYQERLSVIGVANEGDAVVKSEQLQPDIILLDLNLGRTSGLDLIPVFKKKIPKAKVIVLTILEDISHRAAAMQRGADAFVYKTEMGNTLVPVILGLARNSPVSDQA